METPRARRLLVRVPISYRAVSDRRDELWLQGRIINVSETGVMFAPAAVDVGRSIEVIFSTPVSIQSIAPGQLFCVCKVVRTDTAGVAAARFEECRFLLEA
jgi:hypothetical protein